MTWSDGDVFCHAVIELLAAVRYPALELLQPGLMVLHTDESVFILIGYQSEREPQILRMVADLVSKSDGPGLQVALLGGDESKRELLTRTPPGRSSLRMLHLPDARAGSTSLPTVVLGRGRSPLHEALARAAARTGEPVDPGRVRDAIESAQRRFQEQSRERLAFSRLLGERRPHATYAILACIVATFLMELQSGATTSTERLLDMGALYGPLIASGEWWRLASYSLLHGGVMHVGFNGYVLFALGSLIERLLGTPRFLVLYCVSGLVAAAGSLAFSGGVSVGASGAIWGLLGALGALAFGPSQLFPPSVRRSIQRATLINLAINTAASFLPLIDWAAHFAGGAAGAALVFSKLCLPAKEPSARGASPGWTLAAALVTGAFFGAALGGVLGLL